MNADARLARARETGDVNAWRRNTDSIRDEVLAFARKIREDNLDRRMAEIASSHLCPACRRNRSAPGRWSHCRDCLREFAAAQRRRRAAEWRCAPSEVAA